MIRIGHPLHRFVYHLARFHLAVIGKKQIPMHVIEVVLPVPEYLIDIRIHIVATLLPQPLRIFQCLVCGCNVVRLINMPCTESAFISPTVGVIQRSIRVGRKNI